MRVFVVVSFLLKGGRYPTPPLPLPSFLVAVCADSIFAATTSLEIEFCLLHISFSSQKKKHNEKLSLRLPLLLF